MLRAKWFLRALAVRCPLCGTPWPRRGWVRLAGQCPRCDLYLERREHDAFLGAYTINLFATLIVTLAVGVPAAVWQILPQPARDVAVVLVIAAFALGFYPISKLLWLAVDLQFRPPLERDFDEVDEDRVAPP